MTSPQEAAHQAAEGVRTLNHLTLWDGGYRSPAEVDAVLAALEQLAEQLPQAIGQAGAWLETELHAGRLGHDRPDRPDVTPGDVVAVALEELERAGWAAGELALRVHDARQATAHLIGGTDAD